MRSLRLKKAPCTMALVLALLFSTVAGAMLVDVATANPMAFLPYITVRSDGSIEPQTAFLKQDGNVYTLTSDLVRNYSIKIQRSNIIFDGGGHVINGSVGILGYDYYNLGLSLESVTNVTVKDVEVTGFMLGWDQADISLKNTNESVLLRVKIRQLQLLNSSFNTITESGIGDEGHAMLVSYSNNNTVTRNDISWIGMRGYYNTFFENNFGQKSNVSFVSEGNFWDNGSVGNYWSWYNGTDANGDGIGDRPHALSAKDQDRYPLMKPWDPTKPIDSFPPRISVSSPENKIYNESGASLIFLVNEPSSLMSYSLDGQGNVKINGNGTLSWLPNGSHNLTVYATDRSGNMGISEIIYFSVATPFPTVLVVVAVGISAAIIASIGLVYYRKRKTENT